ncbi:hypothetical protein KJF94_19595 [Pseudomonas hormoni]|uniref:DUF3298 domain-containing protein n=1 Tax=Pseudomonas hormoni TaxID=3093767 RepID=A0ABX8ET49_9PSED|nr:hypothetical protein [Pseudomonas hormoni]QVW22070.1 hypothetical protein KJF94_19595 [Pseudomonas hormoni]
MFKGLFRLTGIVVLVCSTFPTVLWADSGKQTYTGMLGKMPIVLEVSADGSEGRYFYQKYRKDLVLSGTKEGETLVLEEGDHRYGEYKPLPTIRLQPESNGWSGEWVSPKGKVLKVQLQPANLPPVPADTLPYLVRLHDKAPYEYLRLQGMKLIQGKTETFMGYTLQWWSEPQSNAELFEVISGYSAEERQRINQQLMGRLWREVVGYYGCFANYADAYYSQISQPLWMTPSVMSVRVSTEYFCGGAYPDQVNDSINFDTKTGKSLTLEDVLWVGQGKPLHYEENYDVYNSSSESSTAYSDYRNKELAPWLVAQLLKLYPTEMTTTPEGENDCGYNDDYPWHYPGWYFTEKGIKLEPSFPHVAAVCQNIGWGVLPYNLVKQHPGGVALQLP